MSRFEADEDMASADRVVMVPHELWSKLEVMADELGVKAQELLTVMLMTGLDRPEVVREWMHDRMSKRGRR